MASPWPGRRCEAYERAYRTDPTSAFGGIIAFNRPLEAATAQAILDRQFVEVLIAPELLEGAAAVLASKPNVRVLLTGHAVGGTRPSANCAASAADCWPRTVMWASWILPSCAA